MDIAAINREAIAATYELIRSHVRRTPVIEVDAADFALEGRPIVFKLELLQHTGSFKPRGALASLLSRPVPPAGVVAASGGNHGLAVAFAAHKLGVPARIFVPNVSAATKRDRIRELGADLVIAGERYADALAASREFAAASGAMEIHAFDQPATLLGQGTVGLEIERQCGGVATGPELVSSLRAESLRPEPVPSLRAESLRPEPVPSPRAELAGRFDGLDTLLVAVGGGGLIGGMAAWFAGRVRLVAVEPRTAPTLYRAREAGHPVDAEAGGIAAESLAPRQVGQLMFPLAQKYVEQAVLVEDDAIREAQRTLWRVMKVASEPGGATAFAALLSGAYRPAAGERVGVVLCGGNTDAVKF
ncbi:MAG TPA: threonine/serine dehydratase [Steroidobacteraceae bacterium]|nr:threonine/serine dehydratase [Steroidobacteraceae bacterium]